MSWHGTMIGLPFAGLRMLLVDIISTRRFELRFQRQRHVHRHLVAVEVGVERGADQRVKLDRLAFDQHRLERLDAQAMQGRRAVQHHRMLADHLFQDVPHLGTLLLHHPLGGLDGGGVAVLLQLASR